MLSIPKMLYVGSSRGTLADRKQRKITSTGAFKLQIPKIRQLWWN